MENLSIFKDKLIVTFNLNGWLPVRRDITFAEKLKKRRRKSHFLISSPSLSCCKK